jgi:uncharacterized protein YciI
MTLYVVTARFRPDVEDQRKSLSKEFGDHLGQPLLHIRLVGVLKSAAGERKGVHMLMEADSRAKIEHFLEQSPYKLAGLYDSVEVDELEIEAGGLN